MMNKEELEQAFERVKTAYDDAMERYEHYPPQGDLEAFELLAEILALQGSITTFTEILEHEESNTN